MMKVFRNEARHSDVWRATSSFQDVSQRLVFAPISRSLGLEVGGRERMSCRTYKAAESNSQLTVAHIAQTKSFRSIASSSFSCTYAVLAIASIL